jgi:hypothetical protein
LFGAHGSAGISGEREGGIFAVCHLRR